MITMLTLIFLLGAGHYLADFALNGGDWNVTNKSPRSGFPYWRHVMLAHCFIQGLMVYGAVRLAGYEDKQALALGAIEIVAHFVIDYLKCHGVFDFATDQFLHIGCKVQYFVWLVLIMKII